jgi:hypothetical protein
MRRNVLKQIIVNLVITVNVIGFLTFLLTVQHEMFYNCCQIAHSSAQKSFAQIVFSAGHKYCKIIQNYMQQFSLSFS